MNAIRILAETKDTVTVKRDDLARLISELEDAEDRSAVAERRALEKALGKERARRNYLTVEEARRLLDGESPVTVWREKRSLTQRSLAARAGIAPSYLTEIEKGRKPGSASTLSRLAGALEVAMEDLMSEQQRHRQPNYGPVLLRWRPHSVSLAAGQRGAQPEEREYPTISEALAGARKEWPSLRNQLAEISDRMRLPILGTEDLIREMEPELLDRGSDLLMLGIRFDEDARWSANLQSYVMWASSDDPERIRCRILRNVFFDCLDDPHHTVANIPKMFQRYRSIFEKAFRNLIHRRSFIVWNDPDSKEQKLEVVLVPENFHMAVNQ